MYELRFANLRILTTLECIPDEQEGILLGADARNRTGDLILTKNVL